MELIDHCKTFFANDRFVKGCGIEIVECREGYAKTQITITDNLLNSGNAVHGGLYFSIADFTAAVAAFTLGKVAVSTNGNISYFKNCNTGILIVEANIISCGNLLCHADVNVFNGETKLVNAKFEMYRTKQDSF